MNMANPFDALSDDLIISILIKTAAFAKSPSDWLGIMSSCKRMRKLGMDPIVLKKASCYAILVEARSWCDNAHQFLSHCSDVGNVDATFMLGMIEFYGLRHYGRGADLLAQAAQASHPGVRFSLAIINPLERHRTSPPHFNLDFEHPLVHWIKWNVLGQIDDMSATAIAYILWNLTKMIPETDQLLLVPAEKASTMLLYNFLTVWWQLSDVNSEIESNRREIYRQLFDGINMTRESLEVRAQKRNTVVRRLLRHARMCIGKTGN